VAVRRLVWVLVLTATVAVQLGARHAFKARSGTGRPERSQAEAVSARNPGLMDVPALDAAAGYRFAQRSLKGQLVRWWQRFATLTTRASRAAWSVGRRFRTCRAFSSD
jgi:hypothetical protein